MMVCWNVTSCLREVKKTVSSGGYRKTMPKITEDNAQRSLIRNNVSHSGRCIANNTEAS